MEMTLDEQMLLHDAAAVCAMALLHPGGSDRIIGLDMDRGELVARLAPALALAWPDHPSETDDLDAFLRTAYKRCVDRARDLAGAEGFVPAAHWQSYHRELLLEHLRDEVEALIGGVRAEGLWAAFIETGDTAALYELIETGLLMKLRVVGAFLVLPPSRYDDELTAAEFFSAGQWEVLRDAAIAANVLDNQKLTHKQIAHLTLTRPIPEDKHVYRPGTYRYHLGDLITLLEQFAGEVDERLVPDWWRGWVGELRARLDA